MEDTNSSTLLFTLDILDTLAFSMLFPDEAAENVDVLCLAVDQHDLYCLYFAVCLSGGLMHSWEIGRNCSCYQLRMHSKSKSGLDTSGS